VVFETGQSELNGVWILRLTARYAPAFRRHGADVSLLHFIGTNKPWHRGTRDSYAPDAASSDYHGLVYQWFDVYERHFGSSPTHTVADKVLPPPVSFKSTFSSLAPIIKLTKATPAVSPNHQPHGDGGASWNPATSEPPSGPGQWQMRLPITDHYDNAWDDPNRAHHRQRFDAPDFYPAVPTSTHEWYAEVMKHKPDPSAVRPVFPWEGGYQAAHEATPSPPPEPARRQFESRREDPPAPAKVALKASTFVNAWDAIPAIDRYAKSLAQSTAPKKGSQGEAADESERGGARKAKKDDLGGRQSSLTEPAAAPSYERRSDASSRDGDDEDTSEPSGEDEQEREPDRVPIKFKSRSLSGMPISAELSPTNTRSSRGYSSSEERRTVSNSSSGSSGSGGDTTATSPPKPRRDSRYVPTSPRQSRYTSGGADLLAPSSPTKVQLRLPPQGLSVPHQASSPGATSPRLMAQAVRNSTAARLVASGAGSGGNAPPVVRATRVFSPETDTSKVKEEGLAALERFVQQMEGGAQQHPHQPAGQH